MSGKPSLCISVWMELSQMVVTHALHDLVHRFVACDVQLLVSFDQQVQLQEDVNLTLQLIHHSLNTCRHRFATSVKRKQLPERHRLRLQDFHGKEPHFLASDARVVQCYQAHHGLRIEKHLVVPHDGESSFLQRNRLHSHGENMANVHRITSSQNSVTLGTILNVFMTLSICVSGRKPRGRTTEPSLYVAPFGASSDGWV